MSIIRRFNVFFAGYIFSCAFIHDPLQHGHRIEVESQKSLYPFSCVSLFTIEKLIPKIECI